MKLQTFGAKSATADSCFGLIGPRQCSALGGPATLTEDLRHQGALNKPGVLKHLYDNLLQLPKVSTVQDDTFGQRLSSNIINAARTKTACKQ